MKYKEPRVMVELHRIRERISREYGKRPIKKINQELLERTEEVVGRLGLSLLKTGFTKEIPVK